MKNKRLSLLFAIILAAPCSAYSQTIINGTCYGTSTSLTSGAFDPNNPAGKNGYQLVFDSEFNDWNDFDLSCTSPPANTGCINPQGKNWYLDSWTYPKNANTTNAATDLAIVNGVLSIRQTIHTGNWAISTMAPHAGASHGTAAWQQNWNGIVFGGGWYVEARLSTEYRDTSGNVVMPGWVAGHPAFWAYAIDHYTGDQHFIEDDMNDGIFQGYLYQMHLLDWTGLTNVDALGTGMDQWHQVDVTRFGFPRPLFVDRTSFHVFGQLWVPATATTQGYVQNYLDGVPTAKSTWDLNNLSAPLPPTGSQVGNIMDKDHIQVILGADPPAGTNPRATEYVDWVHVWQLPTAAAASGNSPVTPQANFTGGNGSCHTTTATNPLPDLIATSISYDSTSGNFTSVVQNIGNAAIPTGVVIGVAYLVDGVKCTWGAINGPLAAGALVTIGTGGGACRIPNGTHTITVVADDVNRIAESNENNNTLSKTIQVP